MEAGRAGDKCPPLTTEFRLGPRFPLLTQRTVVGKPRRHFHLWLCSLCCGGRLASPSEADLGVRKLWNPHSHAPFHVSFQEWGV